MYETYWNLIEKPFQNTSDDKFFFYGETYEEAYMRLLYGVTETKGLLLLTAKGGCGKSFVCKNFFKQMSEQGYRVGIINNPDLDPSELLQQILHEYGVDYKNKNKFELRKELENFVISNAKNNVNSIILIDEAQLMQNEKTLDEIRLMLNWEYQNRLPLSIILFALPEFGQILRQNPSLQSRVRLQYSLKPFSCQETGEYIWYRMNKAGCSRDIFTVDAVKEVYSHSGGIPRQINHICDLALLLGYGESSIVVDATLVKKAADDLNGY